MENLKILIPYLKRFKGYYVFYLTLSLILLSISIIVPLLNGKFIDTLTLQFNQSDISPLLFYIISLSMISLLLQYILGVVTVTFLTKLQYNIVSDILEHLKRVNILDISQVNSGYLTQRINSDTGVVTSFIIDKVKGLLINILTIIGSTIILLNLNLTISVLLIMLFPVYGALFIIFRKKILQLNLIQKENESNFFSEMNFQINNIRYIKAYSVFQYFEGNLYNKFNKLFTSAKQLTLINNLFLNLGGFFSLLANLFVLIIGVREISQDNLTIGEFSIIMTYFNSVISSIGGIQSFLKNYQGYKASYGRISNLIKIEKESNGNILLDSIKEISLNKMSFGYTENNLIFKEFDYTFQKGKIYKIIGNNGLGKSTLTNLITGLYQTVSNNDIKINEFCLKDVDMYNTRKKLFGIVMQDSFVFDESLLSNLTFSQLEYFKEERLNHLLSQLDIKSITSKNGSVLETLSLSVGNSLSGGEKQKINILRALLKSPDVLILDEATSALDKVTTERFIKLIEAEKSERITIVISHDNLFDPIFDEEVWLK